MGRLSAFCISGQTWRSYAGPPSPRGHVLTGILNSWGDPPECRPLEKGRGKGAGWIDGICTNPLLRRSRLCEANPSPALWAAPFSKGGTCLPIFSTCLITNGMPPFAALPLGLNSLHSNLNSIPIMQALGEGPRQRRRMDAEQPLLRSDVCSLTI